MSGRNEDEMMVILGDLIDTASKDLHLTAATHDSEIKSSLKRISATEQKLSDMISRHIKKRGTDRFYNSNFVVTSRQQAAQQSKTTRQETPTPAPNLKQSCPATVEHLGEVEATVATKRGASVPVTAKHLAQLAEQARPEGHFAGKKWNQKLHDLSSPYMQTDSPDKAHALKCFRPREIFNINTHALFQRERAKDSDESGADSMDGDDDEELTQLLLDKEGKFAAPAEDEGDELERSKMQRLDLNQYDSNKPIEHNIRVLRGMIHKAKVMTKTTGPTQNAQTRREQMKMGKFIKRDSVGTVCNVSKIARETEEAIKYLKKRQPLTV